MQNLSVSQRRACQVLGQYRTTKRYLPQIGIEEEKLTGRIIELASQYGRYGYRRITALLQRESWQVNYKRVERIWRKEELKVPQTQPKKGRLWLNDGSCVRLRPEHRDHVWSYDFVMARIADGRTFRLLNIINEYTREFLAIEVKPKITSYDVIDQLFELFIFRGIPEHIRSDNEPEFTTEAVRRWLERSGIKTLFIEPASPWENEYIESFNGKVRDELLNREVFMILTEAQILIKQWRMDCNHI